MNRFIHAALLALVLFPQVTLAIPPPEIIVSIGAQVAAVASVVFLFLSAAFTTAYQLIKTKLTQLARKRWAKASILGILITVVGSGIGAHFYFSTEAENAEAKWLEESMEERTELLVDTSYFELEDEEVINIEEPEEEEPQTPSFWNLHAAEGDTISNVALAEAMASDRNDYVILDARENLEVEAGHIPGSTHIRFADLLNGEWKELDPEKYYFVICASSMRGEEVSSFLRDKELVAQHLEEGAQSWVDYGGVFEGTIVFSEAFSNWYYHAYLTTEKTRTMVADGAILIDSREPDKFESSGIEGSLFMALLYTPSEDMDRVFGQAPAGSSVITLCDDWINCFDAKMTGIELERRGYNFLGRYKNLDEY